MVMREKISGLVDGELPPEEFDAVCSEARRADGMATWMTYHVIGETLRGSAQVNPGFAERFTARLAAEPVVLAPRPRVRHPLNYVWAAAAGLAAMVVTGWVALSVVDQGPGVSALAKVRDASAVRSGQVRPAAVPQDYILAHQEYSPTTPIPALGPAIVPVSVSTDAAR